MLREKFMAALVAVTMFAVVNGAIVGVGLATSDTPQAQNAFRQGAERLARQDVPQPTAVAALADTIS